jgi:uncharacterized protein
MKPPRQRWIGGGRSTSAAIRRSPFLALALALPQTTPSGGAIAKYVPPVPTPASFISDAKNVLGSQAHAALDARITTIQRAGLGDIAVAILPTIGDYSANQVSVEIYRTWRVGSVAAVGSAHRNVGVLLLIVPKEFAPNHRGECWINTGTGAEGIITDATAGTICRDSIIPHLKYKDYAGAVGAGIAALESKLRGDAALANPKTTGQIQPPPARVDHRDAVPGPLIAIGAIVAAIAAFFGIGRWRRNRPRKCPKCGRMMHRLDERADDAKLEPGQVVEEKIGSVDYDVWACECGETTVIPYNRLFTRYRECRECHRRAASSTRTVLMPPTTISSGTAEDRYTCKACGATWTETVILPQLPTPSSSSSGGGGGGGGGGSSFGGSGSTSGGGGGSSY